VHLFGARVVLRSTQHRLSAGRGHPVGPHRVLVNCLNGGGNTSLNDQRCIASGSSGGRVSGAACLALHALLFRCTPDCPGFSPHGRLSHGSTPAPFTGRTAHMRRSSSASVGQDVLGELGGSGGQCMAPPLRCSLPGSPLHLPVPSLRFGITCPICFCIIVRPSDN
jgi:hypothetical protein